MKVLIVLASLLGVILVAIPHPAEGLKCVQCFGDERFKDEFRTKPCKDYKKGDKDFQVDCTKIASGGPGMICAASKVAGKGASGCIDPLFENKLIGPFPPGKCKPGMGGVDHCFCDKDYCNKSTRLGALGGSGAGILIISLGLGLILRQLCY